MSYFPLDRDILTSSLWAEGSPEAIKVWIYLLLEADPRTGVVEDAAPAIALRCGLPLSATLAALDWLAGPDQHSRSKDHEGRRIEAITEGGYRLVNYVHRRDKDYSTPRVQRWRHRGGGVKRDVTVKRSETPPGTTNKNTNTERTEERTVGPANPLIPRGGRPKLESELCGLVQREAELTNRDGAEVMAEVSHYEGARTSKLNPATMSDDRLLNSLLDARARVKRLEGNHVGT